MYEERLTGPAYKAFRMWPREQIRPTYPSTYSPPANLSSRSFVVLAAPRSASNSLIAVLNAKPGTYGAEQNPDVQMSHEVFDSTTVHGWREWTPERRDANRTEFMRMLFELDAPPAVVGAKARGFKAFAWHLSEDELRAVTSQKHVLKIVLRRQDTLSEYVSILRATAVGNWFRPENRDSSEAFASLKVPVCVEAYEKYLEAHSSWYDWCANEAREHPESWHFVSTEHLTAEPYALLSIYAALGVPTGEMLEYSPYTSDNLEEKVSNYADIRDVLPVADNSW